MSNSFTPNKHANKGTHVSSTSEANIASSPSGLRPGRSYADAVRPSKKDTVTKNLASQVKDVQPDASTNVPKAAAILEISTDSEDETKLLADRPLDPGDSMYRGRARSKSRILSVQQHQERSPIQTRRVSAKGTGPPSKIKDSSPLKPLESAPIIHDLPKERSRPKPRPVKRAPKSAPVVVSSGDEGGEPAAPRAHGTRQDWWDSAMDTGDAESLPTMAEIFEQVAREKNGVSRDDSDKNRFIDSEADESGSEGSGDEVLAAQDDEYDYNDPFIDDSAVTNALSQGEDNVGRSSRRGSDASSMQMDLDLPYPGVSEEDPAVTAFKRREKSRQDHENEMAALSQASERHRTFLFKALELLNANEQPDPDLWEDEDRQISLATRESLLDLLCAAGGKRPRPTAKQPHSSKGKGKANPAAHQELLITKDCDSEEDLSDYEKRDRKRLRTALELSKREQPSPVVGGSSRSRAVKEDVTTSTSPGRSSKIPPPSSPKTPIQRRRQKKGVLEMMAAAGAEPVSPPPTSSPPTPSPSSSGLIIESRLLAPPLVNEILLDMSDPIIRFTVNFVLYCLSQGISFKSWNENLVGPGFVKFCAWAMQCPDMDGELALEFVKFRSCGDFANLARMDLSKVYCLRFSSTATRYHAVTKDGNPMIFVSSGFCDSSQLTRPSPVGLKQKTIRVILHEGEHQRTSSAACTVFGFESMKTQYAKHAVQFSTRAEFAGSSNTGNSGSPGGKAVPASLFTGASTTTPSRVSSDSFSLPNTAEVPVYDARDVDDFNVETDLPKLEEKLPRWKEEVPYGSFVVVGYTMTAFFSSSREWTLGMNIQWVIIVGIPVPQSG